MTTFAALSQLLLEESGLVTPEFTGTDEEKISTLQYWADLVKLVRGIKIIIPQHDNQIKILDQIKKELELIQLEVTNTTSQPVHTDAGMPALKKIPDHERDEEVVDLSTTPPENYPASSPFSPHRPLTTEDLNRIARGPSTNDLKKLAGVPAKPQPPRKPILKENPDLFVQKTIDTAGLQKMAGIK